MALTGKTIGDLTFLSEPTSNTLIPVELSGITYHIAYSAITSDFSTRFTGIWTILPGTFNYSFTLNPNSTYQMWILGNVPNGIIKYNANVTISNTNVPVLGTHSAWNYTEGGSPILFTSLPRQIVGVDGIISTSNPGGLGANTNIFSFGIQNNTDSSFVVNYGYVKLS